jgi:uncharacterized protein YraI
MNRLKRIVALAGATMLGIATAQAAPGFATADVNLRAGPDTDYPSVEVIPNGAPVEIAGCLEDESWCDVAAGPNRGWVYSEYLASDRGGSYVLLPDVGIKTLRVPAITFTANEYWQRYYVGRPWYVEKTKWVEFKPHPRIGWRPPPPGPRVVGWWRHGYSAPVGMPPPPPDHGWRRPEIREHEHR